MATRPTVKLYWLSNKFMTIGAYVNNDSIVVTVPPVAKVFRGQNIDNLIRWMKKMDPLGFRMDDI